MKRTVFRELLRSLAILAASGAGIAGWLYAFIHSGDTLFAVAGVTKSQALDPSGWIFGGIVVVATWAVPLYGALLAVVGLQPSKPPRQPAPLPSPEGMLR